MSKTQQNTLIIILAIIVLGLAWWMKQDPAREQLNQVLREDKTLQAYPHYHVYVMQFENGIATLSSPRSPKVSVLHFLNITQPELKDLDGNHEKVIAAQKALAATQERARELMLAQEGVKDTRWMIDKSWYASHGIQVD